MAAQSSQPGATAWGNVEVTAIEGFGQPWVVRRRAVITWDRLVAGREEDMVMKDQIVGAQVELVDAADGGTRLRLSRVSNEEYRVKWVVASIEKYGVMLEKLPDDVDISCCLVAGPFLAMYNDVTWICHKRIWEDNVDTLWEGDRGRMPSRRTITAKLLRPATMVLHATALGEFVGGAIVRAVSVPSLSRGYKEESTVVYLDSCATVPGNSAGKAMWQELTKMPGVLLALHSIPLESTISFWFARGMKQVDPNSLGHQQWITDELMARSGGLVDIRLSDLAAALPRSSLPLFVYVMPNPVSVPRDIDPDVVDGWLHLAARGQQRQTVDQEADA